MVHANAGIARRLREVADLLHQQDANVFRVQAYRNAARNIDKLGRPLAGILEEQGEPGIRSALGIGESLAATIRELILTGKLGLLSRLRGETDPEALLSTVPGIGSLWAERLHEEWNIESLEDLEAAAHDGRLARAGIGEKRRQAIIDSLEARLGRPVVRHPRPQPHHYPVEELLDVDREYRDRAEAGQLRRIAPRRMNPTREAWLPILHTQRGDHSYTALFSNTARAHQLDRTRDWVVIYGSADHHPTESQWTVVTETRGPLAGRRVVRGREAECASPPRPLPS